MPWIPIALAAVQVGAGIIKGANAKKDANRLLGQRQAYKTPQEIKDSLSASEARASQGFDAQTLSFLSTQANDSFASSIGSATRLGADPNVLSAIFHENVNNIMRVGEENHMQNMANFSSYLTALQTSGANAAAEQKSAQDILKDKLQQTANEKMLASQQISEGINTGISAYSSYETGKLFADTDGKDLAKFTKAYGNQGAGAYQYAKENNMTFSDYNKKSNDILKLIK